MTHFVRPVKRALVSVYDKTKLANFARELVKQNVEIIATGGTKRYLQDAKIPVTDLMQITAFPEIMNGRVKTLNSRLFTAILADALNEEHVQILTKMNIQPIDLVVVNFYPFEKVIAKKSATHEEIVENIDIGGPSMMRAASKNYRSVCPLPSKKFYQKLIQQLDEFGGTTLEFRRQCAAETFAMTSEYERIIYGYWSNLLEKPHKELPDKLEISVSKHADVRYGENPHQQAAVYLTPFSGFQINQFCQLHGKALSYNNYLDFSAAVALILEFRKSTIAILKHTNPCGVAQNRDLVKAFEMALACDPVSAFGGIVSCNRQITSELATKLKTMFLECIVAPSFTDEALEILSKKKNLRLIEYPQKSVKIPDFEIRSIVGGLLVQQSDGVFSEELNFVTEATPTDDEQQALQFAWKIVKHVKSNAIVYARENQLLGVGAGQMSRIDSARFAAEKAKLAKVDLTGAVMASDAFFPFRDGIDAAHQHGITAVIQPGGSIRDQEVIDAANEHGMKMVFTGKRHFKH